MITRLAISENVMAPTDLELPFAICDRCSPSYWPHHVLPTILPGCWSPSSLAFLLSPYHFCSFQLPYQLSDQVPPSRKPALTTQMRLVLAVPSHGSQPPVPPSQGQGSSGAVYFLHCQSLSLRTYFQLINPVPTKAGSSLEAGTGHSLTIKTLERSMVTVVESYSIIFFVILIECTSFQREFPCCRHTCS